MNETDACPRCGAGFHCGAVDAPPCACTTIKLDAATLAELRTHYATCLCLKCLNEIAHEKGRPDLAIGRPV